MSDTIDKILFSNACQMAANTHQGQNGIGTLKEKTVHSVLKFYYAPDISCHEIKIGNYVADIYKDGKIYEIQTRNFSLMRNKLNFFLQEYDVTIIYPITHKKWISWLDIETGELSAKRKSPKTGTLYQIIPELYKIKMFINNPNLHFILCFIDVEEIRYLNGWSRDKKKGSSRMDGTPIDIFDEIKIQSMFDYMKFLPDTLEDGFTSKDLAKAAKISQKNAGILLNVLLETNVVSRIGKIKNYYTYQKLISNHL